MTHRKRSLPSPLLASVAPGLPDHCSHPRPISISRDTETHRVVVRARIDELPGTSQAAFLRLDRVEGPGDASALRRRLTELARLEHPNVVRLLSVGCHRSVGWSIWEYVWGFPLARVLKAGPLPHRCRLHIGAELCAAVVAAERRSVDHGGLHGSSVLISVEGDVKLAFPLHPTHQRSDLEGVRDLLRELDIALPADYPAITDLDSVAAIGAMLREPHPTALASERFRLAKVVASRR